MSDALADFKAIVPQRNVGETHVYHTGHLAEDAATSTAVANIQMFASGLSIMGRVELRQKRLVMGDGSNVIEYSMRVLSPINALDFDIARKAHLASFK